MIKNDPPGTTLGAPLTKTLNIIKCVKMKQTCSLWKITET